MGTGVTESYAVGPVPGETAGRSRVGGWRLLTRHPGRGLFLAASLFTVLAVTGIGTGPGPLGDCCGYGVGITRNVGDSFTEGTTVLQNRSWFPIVMEDLRPVPTRGAETGAEVVSVEVATMPAPGTSDAIGTAERDGSQVIPAQRRHPVDGFVLQPEWRVGEHHGLGEVLVQYRIRQEGTWSYRGYELTYRSGLVRHKAVLDVTMTACAPASQHPVGCEPAE
ncbi:hypothetical protein SAMN05216199_3994 [Pedococcus cremeus]|uniref:Uncharacterized protein n=1 Tax=Pedococcus cremeus TaxID=587636 RepID=A0A1H9XLK1_9MICO|nr:hypothetical protein [Pedococcus cremeus]SES47046.1 hypothetical protein SAMN05216199_3994 [Pedococcus cremeus]